MYLARDQDVVLLDWLRSTGRKPLVLQGARQTGKSTTARHLGEAAPLFVELDLERHSDRELVRACRSADELLDALALRQGLPRLPENALLFLDEVQALPRLIPWLRFLHEDHPELAVLCAGSFLEVRLAERGFSFPVGRVTFATLQPFSYSEFLHTTRRTELARRLYESARTLTPLPPAVHETAVDALREYWVVGGMPEAVVTWRETATASAVAKVHADLWDALAEDVQKYRGTRDPGHLEAAFSAQRQHYGKRFKYENFAPGHASRAMRSAVAKLEGARLVTRALPSSSVRLPLETKPRAAPKLIPLDVGLASHALGLDPGELRRADPLRLRDGRLAEMFVGQELRGILEQRNATSLHFWVRASSRANAEVDFLLPIAGRAVPVEVKGGSAGRLRSMHQFLARADHDLGVRIHGGGLSLAELETRVAGNTRRVSDTRRPFAYRLLDVPLYLTGFLEDLVRGVLDA